MKHLDLCPDPFGPRTISQKVQDKKNRRAVLKFSELTTYLNLSPRTNLLPETRLYVPFIQNRKARIIGPPTQLKIKNKIRLEIFFLV